MGLPVELLVFASLFICLAHTSVERQSIVKNYFFEKICEDNYGTMLGNYYKIRDRKLCGVKCTETGGCVSFMYNKNTGRCSTNSDVFVNRTNAGCVRLLDYAEITTVQTLRPVKQPTHCGLVPYIPNIIVNKASKNYSVGSQFEYRCEVCTSFPPSSSPGYLECGADGKWIIPNELCVYGPDVGLLRNGSAIPVDAIGCLSTYNYTCPGSSINPGLLFDGSVGKCWCDRYCCNNQDCCYDTTCNQYDKSYYYDYEYYYYDYYYYDGYYD